jgi:hypothetical protein
VFDWTNDIGCIFVETFILISFAILLICFLECCKNWDKNPVVLTPVIKWDLTGDGEETCHFSTIHWIFGKIIWNQKANHSRILVVWMVGRLE